MSALFSLLLSIVSSHLLAGLGLDARGSFLGAYNQRNVLIVGFVMGFAIIPIIYTIAEDALSSQRICVDNRFTCEEAQSFKQATHPI